LYAHNFVFVGLVCRTVFEQTPVLKERKQAGVNIYHSLLKSVVSEHHNSPFNIRYIQSIETGHYQNTIKT